MPPNFAFPENHRLWIALQPRLFQDPRHRRYLFTFGRLRPGVTAERALGDLNLIAERLAREYPATNEGWSAQIRTLRRGVSSSRRAPRARPDDGRRDAGAVHRLLERRQPAAGARNGAAAGVGDARRARRRTRTDRAAASDRRRRARAGQRAARRGAGHRRYSAHLRRRSRPAAFRTTSSLRSMAARSRTPLPSRCSTSLVFGLVPALQITRRELQRTLEGRRARQHRHGRDSFETRWWSHRSRWRWSRWSARCSSSAASRNLDRVARRLRHHIRR